MNRRQWKSMVVFVVVVVGLSASGYWLRQAGWLQVPRVFDVPDVLAGNDASAAVPEGDFGGEMRERPAGFEDGERPTPPSGAGEQGVRLGGHAESSGLNWDVLPGVLASLWIVGFVIAVLVYSLKGFGFIGKRLQRVTVKG